MELIPFEPTIWDHRVDPATFSGLKWWNHVLLGQAFRGRDGCKSKPPWNWSFGDQWFFDPANDPSRTNQLLRVLDGTRRFTLSPCLRNSLLSKRAAS
jgi:hypothetical protein